MQNTSFFLQGSQIFTNLHLLPDMRIRFIFRKSRSKSIEYKTKGVLYFQITINRKRSSPQATSIEIDKSDWDAKRQLAVGIFADQINFSITQIKNNLQAKELGLKLASIPATMQNVLKSYYSNEIEDAQIEKYKPKYLLRTANEYLEEQIQLYKIGQRNYDTIKNHQKRIRNIELFFHEKYMTADIDLKNVTISVLNDFENYLLIQRKLHQNYVSKHIVFLKTIINFAILKGYLSANQLSMHRCKWDTRYNPVALTTDEYDIIRNLEFRNKTYEKVRDAFVFCCETSFHYKDFCELKDSHIQIDMEGDYWIIKERVKTGVVQRVPLSDIAVQILKKYGSLENMPKLSNVRFNEYLKAIASIAMIDKVLTFKVARKTFVEQMYNQNEIRSEIIADIVGWTSTRPLKVYSSIHNNTLKKAIKKKVV